MQAVKAMETAVAAYNTHRSTASIRLADGVDPITLSASPSISINVAVVLKLLSYVTDAHGIYTQRVCVT